MWMKGRRVFCKWSMRSDNWKGNSDGKMRPSRYAENEEKFWDKIKRPGRRSPGLLFAFSATTASLLFLCGRFLRGRFLGSSFLFRCSFLSSSFLRCSLFPRSLLCRCFLSSGFLRRCFLCSGVLCSRFFCSWFFCSHIFSDLLL